MIEHNAQLQNRNDANHILERLEGRACTSKAGTHLQAEMRFDNSFLYALYLFVSDRNTAQPGLGYIEAMAHCNGLMRMKR